MAYSMSATRWSPLIYDASPPQPCSEHQKDCTRPHFSFYPSETHHTSISPSFPSHFNLPRLTTTATLNTDCKRSHFSSYPSEKRHTSISPSFNLLSPGYANSQLSQCYNKYEIRFNEGHVCTTCDLCVMRIVFNMRVVTVKSCSSQLIINRAIINHKPETWDGKRSRGMCHCAIHCSFLLQINQIHVPPILPSLPCPTHSPQVFLQTRRNKIIFIYYSN